MIWIGVADGHAPRFWGVRNVRHGSPGEGCRGSGAKKARNPVFLPGLGRQNAVRSLECAGTREQAGFPPSVFVAWPSLAPAVVQNLTVNDRKKEAEEIAASARAEWDDSSFHAGLEKALEGVVPDPWP